MRESESVLMADGQRALLTDTERAILTGEREVSDNYRHTVVSRVRRRINYELSSDVDVLASNQPELFTELQSVVCGD